MLFVEWVYLLLFLSLFVFLALVLGNYLGQVFQGETTVLHKGLGWLERATYKITHIDPNAQMDFSKYVKSLFFFHLFGFLFLLLIQAFQFYLPLNFQGFTSVSPLLNANVSMSFVTNTNWQSYAGETTLSNLCQMVGLTSQNFLSAAVGMAVLFALIRGIKQSKTPLIGNFWVNRWLQLFMSFSPFPFY